jgi:hypothetical protein
MSTLVRSAVALLALASVSSFAVATPAIDQQQPTVDANAGPLAIGGGNSNQKLAQVVTAGISGTLAAVRLPIACSQAGPGLVIEIQDVTAGIPNGTVLASQFIPASSLPPAAFTSPPEFRELGIPAPPNIAGGTQFAIVLKSAGECAVSVGPVGDSYPGGNLYFDARPNPPGWVCVCSFPGDRFDLPFQTLVEPFVAPIPATSPLHLVLIALLVATAGGARLITAARRR